MCRSRLAWHLIMGMGNIVLGSVCQYTIVICSVLSQALLSQEFGTHFYQVWSKQQFCALKDIEIKSSQNNCMSHRTLKSGLVKSTIVCPIGH